MNLSACSDAPKLVSIGLLGRVDRGVEVLSERSALLEALLEDPKTSKGDRKKAEAEVAAIASLGAALAADAPVCVGVSGGKDSCAAALATFEYLDAIGHAGPRILVHADLGDPDPALDVEWSDSLPTCRRLADRLGVELLVARRPAGGMMRRWQGRWSNNVRRYENLECVKVILPWSTPSMRFCTSELKSAPIAAALVKRFPGQTIVSAAGVRREEGRGRPSNPRTNAPAAKANKRLDHKGTGTSGFDWNPIAAWTERDVYAYCAARGFDLHEGYTLHGMRRISCRLCVMQDIGDMRASVAVAENRPVGRTIVALEVASTFGFQGSRWVADIMHDHLDAPTLAAVAEAKQRAASREEIEARIPDHLLYTEGWPTVMPTIAEAEMLAEVRRAIAALLGLDVKYTDAAAVIARYAELMAANAARQAANAKAKKKPSGTRPSKKGKA